MARRFLSVYFGGFLALLGTTCCALPAFLVALGLGGAVASLMSTAPWLVELSRYKEWVFVLTTFVLAYAWWRLSVIQECNISDAQTIKLQKVVLMFAAVALLASVFVAYALLPLVKWVD